MVLRMIQNVPEQGGARTGGVNLALISLSLQQSYKKKKREIIPSNVTDVLPPIGLDAQQDPARHRSSTHALLGRCLLVRLALLVAGGVQNLTRFFC